MVSSPRHWDFGLPLHVTSVGINAAGLLTNRHAQVMHVRGAAIPGLFATGNCTAYQSGLANLRGMVGGYLAACRAVST